MLEQLLHPKILQSRAMLRSAFLGARPFKHVVVDDFLASELAEGLLRDFPSFSADRARNEFGDPGGKATFEDVRQLSDPYRRADELVSSKEFLAFISELTDIPELLYDPTYFGGGTHENRQGQELDPHVDFNYDPRTGHHRRLNLIIYLNKEWEESWGGSIEVHSNPRDWKKNEVRSFSPIFNRCILFETNEYSWHGFPAIRLPEKKRHLSRKSFTIYYYTRERPHEEVAPSHGTFYVQRPLPPELVPGTMVTPELLKELNKLIHKRDAFIRFYQKQELEHSAQLQTMVVQLDKVTQSVRLPCTGWGLEEGPTQGYWHDGWVGKKLSARFRALRQVSKLRVEGWLPDFLGSTPLKLMVGSAQSRTVVVPGAFELRAPAVARAGEEIFLEVEAGQTTSGKRRGVNEDTREISFVLRRVEIE